MKKTSGASNAAQGVDELRPEYHFDREKAKPNRFASVPQEPRVVVVLDPDVAEVFQTPDSVNQVLRALLKAMPRPKDGKAAAGRARTGA